MSAFITSEDEYSAEERLEHTVRHVRMTSRRDSH